MSFNPNPWVKGFKPPSKCPACQRVYRLIYTGKRTKGGDHLYTCTNCGLDSGAPTMYASCKRFPQLERLEKDIYYTPCRDCPHRRTAPGSGVCIHWNPIVTMGDFKPDISKILDKTIVNTKIHKHDEKIARRDTRLWRRK